MTSALFMRPSTHRPAAVPMTESPYLRFVCALLVGALLAAGCGKQDGTAGGPGGSAMPALPVTVIEAQPQRVPIVIEGVGQTEGAKQVEVRARVSGILLRRNYTEGDRVLA